MKLKTRDLTGAALDWAVAKCEGKEKTWGKSPFIPYGYHMGYRYSENWMHAGIIIQRERINLYYLHDMWRATAPTDEMSGETPLVAAMRCYVASKLGREVEIPYELA